jgi:hypothetical protein
MKDTIHSLYYINSALFTRFLDIRVAPRFLIQGSTALVYEKLSIVFWARMWMMMSSLNFSPKTIDSVSFPHLSGLNVNDKAFSRNV